MKHLVLAAVLLVAASPAVAQFGQLGRVRQRAEQVKKIADINISDRDERAIGEVVSARLVDRFGIYQDPAVTRYVTLAGTVLAQSSTRSGLDWRFIVLDTDGVNAYAAPGGLVHITRGALGLIKSEAELAGVLGHEIAHVTEKHTVRAIQKSKAVDVGTDEIGAQGGLAGTLVNRLADMSYDMVFNNKFNRDDENESDRIGITLANSAGYSPQGMSAFLTHIAERNKGMTQPNGLFATHPQLKERMDRLARTIEQDRLAATATVQPRYAAAITFDAKPVTEIAALDEEGVRGAVGGGSGGGSKATDASGKDDAAKGGATKVDGAKEEAPRRRGFGGLARTLSGGKQAESTQASASAGGRMGVPDTNAPGGTVKTPVRVTMTAADIAEFRKGIV